MLTGVTADRDRSRQASGWRSAAPSALTALATAAALTFAALAVWSSNNPQFFGDAHTWFVAAPLAGALASASAALNAAVRRADSRSLIRSTLAPPSLRTASGGGLRWVELRPSRGSLQRSSSRS